MMADCPKLAKRRQLEEDPDAEKCQNCNTPGHEEENCYFGANMWTTDHRSGTSPKPKRKLLKLTNKPENL